MRAGPEAHPHRPHRRREGRLRLAGRAGERLRRASGGNVWIPNNPLMPGVGVADSAEEAVTYIMSLSRDVLEERLVRAYVEAGAEMVGFLDPEAGTDFYVAEGSPDYHPEHPGGKPQGGRTLETPLFPGAMLGNMREAWWSPVADLPPGVNDMNRVMVDADRTRPRSIMANRRGRRFTNEAANYNAFGGAFHAPGARRRAHLRGTGTPPPRRLRGRR